MTLAGVLGLVVLGLLLAMAAGAVGGLRIGADALGKELAALLGAFYGPTSVLPAVLIGLLVLYFAK